MRIVSIVVLIFNYGIMTAVGHYIMYRRTIGLSFSMNYLFISFSIGLIGPFKFIGSSSYLLEKFILCAKHKTFGSKFHVPTTILNK